MTTTVSLSVDIIFFESCLDICLDGFILQWVTPLMGQASHHVSERWHHGKGYCPRHENWELVFTSNKSSLLSPQIYPDLVVSFWSHFFSNLKLYLFSLFTNFHSLVMTSALHILLILESNHTCAPRVKSSSTNDSARLNPLFVEPPGGQITNNLRFDLLYRYHRVAIGGWRPTSVAMRNEAYSSPQLSCLWQYLCPLTSSFLNCVWISVSLDSYSNEWLPRMDKTGIPSCLRKMTSWKRILS